MSLRRVEIAVRVRAPDGAGDASCVTLNHDTHRITVEDELSCGGGGAGRRTYKEDLLFDERTTNLELYEALVQSKMRSATPEQPDTLCFLAYGHTSSGKTYSIAGTDEQPGILRLCVEELLQREGLVEVSMVEVYMDSVNDLLAEGQARQIRRRQGPQGPVIMVEGLTTCSLTSMAQWKAVSAYGMRARRTAATERNARSSRSHAIFTIKSRSVRLCLVDLAGSERQSVFSPQLNRESISINKSLSRLSTVLEALSGQRAAGDGRPAFVNFRDTTLTVLLQRYLTGASLTTFLACVHPGAKNYLETVSTLRYTQRLKRIRTRSAATHAAEWSGLQPAENGELLDELARLRLRVRESEDASRLVEAAQQRRIAELERTLAAQQRAVPPQPPLSDGRARDTRRVAGWLLSRVLGDLPQLSVGYDQYFDSYFPPSVQVIGYVSPMAALAPRDTHADPLAFLDVGDLAMGLSMLDAGIPPFVRLHRAGCAAPSGWESQDWEGEAGAVYVLAFFECHRTAMAAAGVAQGEEGEAELFSCCGGYVTSAPLLPIATVLCVSTSATRLVKERVLQRLIDLQCEQQDAVEERGGTAAVASPSSSSQRDRLPDAAELLDASLLDDNDGMDGEGGHAAPVPLAETSLLALELRRQAADTSHLVTPYKESSSAAGSSRSSTPLERSAAGAAAAASAAAGAGVRRALLDDFGPAAAADSGQDSTVEPPPPPPVVEPVAEEPPADGVGGLSAPPQSAAPSSAPPPPPPSAARPPPPPFKKRQRGKDGVDKTAVRHGCSGCFVL